MLISASETLIKDLKWNFFMKVSDKCTGTIR